VNDAAGVPYRERGVSVSDFVYPGNERARPRVLPSTFPDVTLAWCELVADDAALRALSAWLSPTERARSSRFATRTLADRYRIGRAALRWLLGSRLGIDPGDVAIERDARGRPRLADGALDFNISHTRDVALVGICSGGTRIGVDVEHEARSLDHVGLARKFLTPREQSTVAALDEDAHRKAFLARWTCKEAMSKATGDALSAPLRKLDVELSPTLRLVDGPSPYTPVDWRLEAAAVPSGYLATVALWTAATGSRLARSRGASE
jgi:4'-phosphopantetheinyl transferase